MTELEEGGLKFMTYDFQNKSLIVKANRAIDKRVLAYCGGSISTLAHYEKMAIQLQWPPIAWEVVEKTKKLKFGEWVNDKTRELAFINY
ncbi:hypothetical protein CR513_36981, partial [Mucuna pruriens]